MFYDNYLIYLLIKSIFLFFVVNLDNNDADILVIGVVCHLGDMPVSREEDKELVGSTVIE